MGEGVGRDGRFGGWWVGWMVGAMEMEVVWVWGWCVWMRGEME